jgi:hypothetical protein
VCTLDPARLEEGDLIVRLFTVGGNQTQAAGPFEDRDDWPAYCTGEVETWQGVAEAATPNGRIQPGRYEVSVFWDANEFDPESGGEGPQGLDTISHLLTVKRARL